MKSSELATSKHFIKDEHLNFEEYGEERYWPADYLMEVEYENNLHIVSHISVFYHTDTITVAFCDGGEGYFKKDEEFSIFVYKNIDVL